MTSRGLRRGVVAALLGGALTIVAVGGGTPAVADTDAGTLSGEGGTFLQPVVTKVLGDATPVLDGLNGSYVATGLDTGVADFVGTSPGQFGADFAVTERPLTEPEASAAADNGRPFAYVPFAATPVAVATLVPNSTYSGAGGTIDPATDLCQHVDLTVDDLGGIFGIDAAQPVASWGDSRLLCSNGGTLAPDGISLWANADPTMENLALMSLLDSDPTAKGYFQAGLTSAFATQSAVTTDPTPSEHWPYSQNTIIGGDNPLLGHLLTIDATTNTPSMLAANWVLGAVFPISSIWTGAPLGAPLNLPTAAVQNADSGTTTFVAPSETAAAAAEQHITIASNNTVTFNPSTTDATAYNNYLMVESYLVVPTSGLPANKATALANLVRYVLGPTGQAAIARFGAAPATTALVTAGLQVAAQLDTEAALVNTASTTTTTTSASGTTTTTTPTTTTTGTGSSASPEGGTSDGTGGSSGGGGGLAFTGVSDTVPLGVVGSGLVAVGATFRRRHRRALPRGESR